VSVNLVKAPAHGFWIQTHTGMAFDLSDPHPSMFRIEDVAYSLAHQCRFTGHCSRHYSVSEHSRHVARMVKPEWRLAALLHEVEEAYIGDLSSPFKALLRSFPGGDSALGCVVAPIKRAAQLAFDLDLYQHSSYSALRRLDIPQMRDRGHAIKQVDLRMLATERRDLMPADPDWGASWFAATGHPKPEPYEWGLSHSDGYNGMGLAFTPEAEVAMFLADFQIYGGTNVG
jgi:hypothetical protein